VSRSILRYVLAKLRVPSRSVRNILVVGTNLRTIGFAGRLEGKPELGYQLIGFVDTEWAGLRAFRKTGYPLVASFSDFPAYLRDHVVDEVVIGLPINSLYQQASRVAAICEEQGIMVRSLFSLFDLKLGQSSEEMFQEDSIVTLYGGTMNGWRVVLKRTVDFSLSLVLLLLFAPLFFLTAVLIKVTDPGPLFFVQDRVGFNKRRFRLYKFRTMIPDAERKLSELERLNEMDGPVFKIKEDPRITPIGRLLRRTSIDELPQLFNVLKGDMSLVGPRPLPVRDYNQFKEDSYRRRFSVRPGITCLWQINGRNLLPFAKWMELDLFYIDHWSLWLDFRIMAKTIPAVLRGPGAA
jgi:exopolysaccharide biosynthesis polyprenyl glycosylphosphotransferase